MQIPAFTIVLCLFVTTAYGQISGSASVDVVPRRQLTLPATPFRYADQALPRHVRQVAGHFDNTPESNPITDQGATLGRVLFYDPKLSANGSTSCSSCHSQRTAFTDARRFSQGFQGKEVDRNSMSLVNLRYYRPGKFFWDERADSLEEQVLMPIENPIEMGHELSALISQLQSDPIYPPLFNEAFGTSEVTKERLARALAQFIRSLVSVTSRFDQGRAEVNSVLDPFPNFSEQENYGKKQFFGRARCAECHLPEMKETSRPARQSAFFQLEGPLVNGIDSDSDQVDGG
ncbi:MAG: cytochrome-c peroxidase, partial [Rubripirellula sp.]